MGLDAKLLDQGYTLPGAPRKTIPAEGGDAVQMDGFTNIAHALKLYVTQQKIQDQDKQQKIKEKQDAYTTYRSFGYSPKKSMDLINSNAFPTNAPDDSPMAEKKVTADIAKTNADTGLVKAQTDAAGVKKNTIEAKILNKLASGQDLLPGEQKIYDDVIKKKNNGGLAEMLSQLNDTGAGDGGTTLDAAAPDADVAVISPDGKKGKIKASKLATALSKGFKKQQ